MVVRIFIWFTWYLLQLQTEITLANHMDWAVNLLCHILGEAAVTEVFCSRFKFQFLFLFRSSLHGSGSSVDFIGSICNVTMNYWIEHLHLSCGLLTRVNLNGAKWLEELDWSIKVLKRIKNFWWCSFLEHGRKIPVEELHF